MEKPCHKSEVIPDHFPFDYLAVGENSIGPVCLAPGLGFPQVAYVPDNQQIRTFAY